MTRYPCPHTETALSIPSKEEKIPRSAARLQALKAILRNNFSFSNPKQVSTDIDCPFSKHVMGGFTHKLSVFAQEGRTTHYMCGGKSQVCAGLNRALLTEREVKVWSSLVLPSGWSEPVLTSAWTWYDWKFRYGFREDGTHGFIGPPEDIPARVQDAVIAAENQRSICEGTEE